MAPGSDAAAAGTRFGPGSRGSFVVHPEIPWCTTDLELVTLFDRATDKGAAGPGACPRCNP